MSKFIHNLKEQKGYLLILILVSPILALFSILKLKNEKEIIFFGTLIFGMLGSVYIYSEGNDGFKHRFYIQRDYMDMSIADFFTKAYDVLTFNSGEGVTDIYLHTLSYISGPLLNIPELLHVLAGLVLGYFFTKSVLLVLDGNFRIKKSYIVISFIFLFLLIRSASALNSIRMWSGMWILFYGTYSFAKTKEKKYFKVIIFSILVHFSYAIIIIPILAAYLIRERKRMLVLIYALSFFSTLSFSYIESYIPQSNLLETKQSQYALDSEEKKERFENRSIERGEINDNKSFYSGSGQENYLTFSIVGLTIILLLFYLKTSDSNFTFLIAIGTGLYSFSNLVAFSPSLQGRTKMIAATFILAAAIHLQFALKDYGFGEKTKRRFNQGLVLFLLSSLPMIIFQISYILQGFSFFLLLFPQLSWIMGDNDFSIREAIGFIID